MKNRRGSVRKAAYGLLAFLFAGCCCLGAVEGVSNLVADEEAFEPSPWVIGFGGAFLFVASAMVTVVTARHYLKDWQLRLFGKETWAVLAAKYPRRTRTGICVGGPA